MLNFKNIIWLACSSKLIIIFASLNFKNINDMKNFIEVTGTDGTSTLVNVNQIAAIVNSRSGITMHIVGSDDVFPSCTYLQLKHLIEESYL